VVFYSQNGNSIIWLTKLDQLPASINVNLSTHTTISSIRKCWCCAN